MEFKGTKGLWVFDNLNMKIREGNIESQTIIADVGIFREEAQSANALLISKSPEMLEMLKRVNESLLNDACTLEQMDLRQDVELLIMQATDLL